MGPFLPSRFRVLLIALASVVIFALIWRRESLQNWTARPLTREGTPAIIENIQSSQDLALAQLLQDVSTTSESFINDPLPDAEFGKMGKRLQVLKVWIDAHDDDQTTSEQATLIRNTVERTLVAMFSFLRGPADASGGSFNPFGRRSELGSKGIVIPTGTMTFRYACHLIGNLRDVLKSTLPIEIAYAGEADLPFQFRDFITSLSFNITTVDITTVFNDAPLDLKHGGWAVKSFATLASQFEQVMMLDADAVFLQAPEVLFDSHTGFRQTGALLFHDRLLWQGAFKARHEWWEKELRDHQPSPALSKSLVYNNGYAEECDAGLVMIDKSRVQILLGLLHVCWQNTKSVRDAFTYKMGYGDKESWWLGLELAGAKYAFEGHYGSMLGSPKEGDPSRVCSFTIAHVDEHDRLVWYNGSLLKNKLRNTTEFEVPTHWMMDGEWEKGATKPDPSCMKGAKVRETSSEERSIVLDTVKYAEKLDDRFEKVVSLWYANDLLPRKM